MDYDPEDCTVTLHIEYLPAVQGNIVSQSPVIAEELDIVGNQARQGCSCDEETRGLAEDETFEMDDLCLPCQARSVFNMIANIAERG